MPTKTSVKKAPAAVKAAPKKKVAAVAKKPAAKKLVVKTARVPKSACVACKGACRQEEAFWVNNGPVIDSLLGLKQALKDMSDEQFAYHTARAGNDFAAWVRDCLGDQDGAARIAKAQTKEGAVRAIVCSCKA